MKITDKGLVLKQVKLREADQILTILTKKHGVVSVSARGSLRPKNKFFSASGLYCYSEWTLHEGKTMFSADDAAPLDVFFGLRNSIEGLALAAYVAELLIMLSPTGQECEKLLRLALNCFYILGENKMEPALAKAVFELRALSESGYMPDLLACSECAKYEEDTFYFEPHAGTLLCGECAKKRGIKPNLNTASLSALRHVVLCDDNKIFSFNLSGASRQSLSAVAEAFVLYHLDYPPKTLEFLKTVLMPVNS